MASSASATLVVHVSTPAAIVQRESVVEPVVLLRIVSFTLTPGCTFDVPLFFFLISYVLRVLPSFPTRRSSDLSSRSADLVTVSVSDALLLPGMGSGTGLLSIVAVLVRV